MSSYFVLTHCPPLMPSCIHFDLWLCVPSCLPNYTPPSAFMMCFHGDDKAISVKVKSIFSLVESELALFPFLNH